MEPQYGTWTGEGGKPPKLLDRLRTHLCARHYGLRMAYV